MRISDVSKIREIVERLKSDDADYRAENRTRINNLFNGKEPYTEQETEENSIFTNVQPLMAPRIAHEARRQLAQASMRTGKYFTIAVDMKDKEQAAMASAVATSKLNRILKASMPFYEVLRGADANVVLHGRGPSMWDSQFGWCPKLLSVEDLKVPSNTRIDFSNASYFAVYQETSAAELLRKIGGKYVDKGWNVPAVKRLIAKLAKEPFETTTDTDYDFPEKLAEQLKQNGLFYGTDLVPTAKLWWFYQLTDDEDEPRWERCIIEDVRTDEKAEFIYQQRNNFTDDLSQIIHVQYADGGNVAPFTYHSVRGMGYMLYPVLTLLNRLFCRFMDSLFEACNQLFTNVGEQDREKLASVVLANMSCLPPGVSFVPAQDRYSVNHNLINSGFAMLRQFINENSASFVQDPDSGTRKAMTATEVMAQVQQAGVLLTSLIQMQAVYRQQQYREIARRFTLKNSTDKDVKKFQEQVQKEGYPPEIMDFDRWEILPERTIGGGNKVLEISQVGELMKAFALYPPESQKIILRDFTLAQTDDPDKTTQLVPEEPKPPSATATFASLAFGSLAQGSPVILDKGLNLAEYVQVLTQLLVHRVQQLSQMGEPPSMETIMGLGSVIQHIQTVLQQLAGAEAHKDVVKRVMQALSQIGTVIAAMAKQQPEAQVSPETQGKIVSMQTLAESKARIGEQQAALKMKQREEAHQQRLAADKLKTQADIEAEDYKTAADIARSRTQENVQQNKPEKKNE